MAAYPASAVSLVLVALSSGPSYAHVLEALPRLSVWPAELWRDATVFHRQFEWYALIGAPVDVAAIVAAFTFAFLVRDRTTIFWLLATWKPGVIAPDFDAVRRRWETGHMVVAAVKFCGLILLCLAVAGRSLNDVKPLPR